MLPRYRPSSYLLTPQRDRARLAPKMKGAPAEGVGRPVVPGHPQALQARQKWPVRGMPCPGQDFCPRARARGGSLSGEASPSKGVKQRNLQESSPDGDSGSERLGGGLQALLERAVVEAQCTGHLHATKPPECGRLGSGSGASARTGHQRLSGYHGKGGVILARLLEGREQPLEGVGRVGPDSLAVLH